MWMASRTFRVVENTLSPGLLQLQFLFINYNYFGMGMKETNFHLFTGAFEIQAQYSNILEVTG